MAEFLRSNNQSSSKAENSLNDLIKTFGNLPNFLEKANFVQLSKDAKMVMLKKDNVADANLSSYLDNMIKEYLAASGGVANVKQIGRYLKANKCICIFL